MAVGIIKAAKISEALGVAKPGLSAKLAEDFKACHLPVDMPCPEEEIQEAMKKDKKAEGGAINFVLIKKIGKVTIQEIHDLHKYSE